LQAYFLIALAVYPTLQSPEMAQNPFYAVDQQVEQFEKNINNEDAQMMLADYTL
jgi:hypothetical protein